jgi:hypothetical protein
MMYPIVGLRYISKHSANMDWDFIVRVLSCVWRADHKCFIVYEWNMKDGVTMGIGMDELEAFNNRFSRYKEI